MLEQVLAEYLELQMERIKIENDEKKNEIAKIMQSSLNKFHAELPKEQRQNIDNIIATLHENITYSFVSFNYTDTLDRCVQIAKEKIPNSFGTHRAGSGIYNHVIGSVLHIHGTTTEEMVVGVNDVSQIANEGFRNNQLYCEWLIKAAANQRFSQNKIKEAEDIISGSVVICIFGMSVGKTDKMWWERIGKWLKSNMKHRLIIYVKKDMSKIKRVTKRILFLSQNEVLEKLELYLGLKAEEWNAIRGQVYIKFDTDIFDFNLTEKL